MDSKLLTPRMASVLERIHRANRPAFHTLSPREARLACRAGAEILAGQVRGRIVVKIV